MRRLEIFLVSSAVLIFTISAAGISADSERTRNKNLFCIEKNKNANVVMYDARVDSDGSIDKSNPVDAYWILHAKEGERSEIEMIEKRAFGFNVVYNADGYYDLTLKAVPDRSIKIVMVNGEPKALIKINNRDVYLLTVFVFIDNSLIPKVLYYTLTGVDAETGAQVTEKITVR